VGYKDPWLILTDLPPEASRLSDSNGAILAVKELHLVPQWVGRCLGKRRLMRQLARGFEEGLTPGAKLSDAHLNKPRLINSLWTKVSEGSEGV
jgi:hypothetical protein